MSGYNFGAASARDSLVYGSTRPGFGAGEEVPRGVPTEAVADWCQFMQQKGIKRILSLLNDDEANWYQTDIEQQLKQHGFKQGSYDRVDVKGPHALEAIRNALRKARQANEKIVVHCSGGCHRAGLGLCLWMCDEYGLAPEDACAEIVEYAAQHGAQREPELEDVKKMLEKGTLA